MVNQLHRPSSRWSHFQQLPSTSFSGAPTDLPVVPSSELLFPTDSRQPSHAGVTVDNFIVKYRPPQAAEVVGQWEDAVVTDDLFGPFSSPEIELKVVGKLIPAKLHAGQLYSGVRRGAMVVLLGADGLEIDLSGQYSLRLAHDWELERSQAQEFLSRA
jgi:hypothetical protein